MTQEKYITLSELNSLIGEAIAVHLESSYWIVAELIEVRENYSGHCYLSLAEKENDKVLAQSRAVIWQQTFRMIKPYFESATGQVFAAGIKVRIKVSVSFHNVYGINLTVQDIDPSYTVGEVIMRRQQILQQLENDGVAEMNRELIMSDVPQRIAIISSPTAAGYGDFVNQLQNNSYGYKFHTQLFSATMQGEGAESSVIKAMEQVFDQIDKFDVLVIIRGGGATIDLSCFDNYNIACYVAQFPIPVVVGIGHERDETVLDWVAHTALKTPTAVAAFFIEKMQDVDAQLNIILERLQSAVQRSVVKETQHIYTIANGLSTLTSRVLADKKLHLYQLSNMAENAVGSFLSKKNQQLDDVKRQISLSVHDLFLRNSKFLEKAELVASLSDPHHVLAKGYSITLKDGQLVKSSDDLCRGDKLTTILDKGTVESLIQ